MPKRLYVTLDNVYREKLANSKEIMCLVLFLLNKQQIKSFCKDKNLDELEINIMTEIYANRKSINQIADTLEVPNKHKSYRYSTRQINRIHKEAFLKLF